MPKDTGIGASSKRREDVRFLSGRGNYTDDLTLHGQTFAVFVRSNVAHGRIKTIDTSTAAKMPGVLAIFTGEDFKDVGGNPAGWLINSRDGTPMREPKRPVLAHGKVRHVGDAYARWWPKPMTKPRMPRSSLPMTARSRNCPPSST